MPDDQKEAAPIDATKDNAQPLVETVKIAAEKPKRTVFEVVQSVSAVVTAIAAVVVAVIAGNVQNSITEQTVSKDYVALSIGILERDPKIGPDPLRDYAVALLAAKSPITILEDAKLQLRSYRLDLGPVKAVEMSGAHTSATTVPSLSPNTTP